MILNASGRTDMVAFYTNWFMNRYKEGFVDVRNPFNPHLVSRIYFDNVDLIMFCTKNPIPILDKLHEIDKKILFHVTMTPYKKDIEPHVPNKGKIIKAIQKLSKIIGKENLTIRYDPIFISDRYNLNYHIKAFNNLCNMLDGYIDKILISFMDEYKNVLKNRNILKYKYITEKDYEIIGKSFSKIAKEHNIKIYTCAEKRDLTEYGFDKGECLSHSLAYKLTGKKYKDWKARGNKYCNCVQMVDIGTYNTCPHMCHYCYANFDETKVLENTKKHDPTSSLLIGTLEEDDIIKIRTK